MEKNITLFTSNSVITNKPIEEIIDEILAYAKSFPDREFNDYFLKKKFIEKYMYSLDLCIKYLIEEKLITEGVKQNTNDGDRFIETLKYTLTLKGELFKGYVHESYEKLRLRKQEEQIRLLTLFLAIGSIGVLVIETMKFLLDYVL